MHMCILGGLWRRELCPALIWALCCRLGRTPSLKSKVSAHCYFELQFPSVQNAEKKELREIKYMKVLSTKLGTGLAFGKNLSLHSSHSESKCPRGRRTVCSILFGDAFMSCVKDNVRVSVHAPKVFPIVHCISSHATVHGSVHVLPLLRLEVRNRSLRGNFLCLIYSMMHCFLLFVSHNVLVISLHKLVFPTM